MSRRATVSIVLVLCLAAVESGNSAPPAARQRRRASGAAADEAVPPPPADSTVPDRLRPNGLAPAGRPRPSYGDSLKNTFKPNFGNADLEKLKAKVDADQAAKAAAKAEAEAAVAAVAEVEVAASRGRLGTIGASLAGLAKKLRLGKPAGLAAAAVGAAWVTRRVRLSRAIEVELKALRTLTHARRLAVPESPASRSALLNELRARRELLSRHVLPMLRQLEETPPRDLAASSAVKLEVLNGSLTDRVAACADVLAAYGALGQEAPPDFRSWGLPRLIQRHDNLTIKWPELNAVLRLEARLGRPKMDFGLPEWPKPKLLVHAEALEAKVAETAGRKEKDALLGKVEAELWRRSQEVPIGLPLKSTDELRALLASLRGAGAPAAAKGKIKPSARPASSAQKKVRGKKS